jgi:hypothetical protein
VGYVPFAVDEEGDDPDTLAEQSLDDYATLTALANPGAPSWEPVDGDPAAPILTAQAYRNAELRTLTRDVSAAIFAAFGRTVLDVTQTAAAPATLTATLVLTDTDGHTVPAGLQFSHPGDGIPLIYEVVANVLVPTGDGTAVVDMSAFEPGAAGNAPQAGDVLQPVDALPWIVSATVTTDAAGGADAETTEDYVDRLSDVTGTLRVGVANARDAAILARTVPGVGRALAIDGWDPDDDTLGHELAVGVAAVTATGEPLPALVKAALVAYLTRDDIRTLNVVVKVADPDYTAVAVVFTAVADPEHDPAAVEAAAETTVAAMLDPATWGGGDESPPAWHADAKTVRYLDIAAAIGRVDGIAHLTALTLNGGTANVVLTGIAALPSPATAGTPTTVAGTVTAP